MPEPEKRALNVLGADIAAEKMEEYRRTARARWQAEQRRLEARREEAWALARDAAALLKERFGVSRVVVFGSLTHPGRFNAHSDVDLAAWGLTSANWLRAMGDVRELSREIDLNVVDVACCAPALLRAIEEDGTPL